MERSEQQLGVWKWGTRISQSLVPLTGIDRQRLLGSQIQDVPWQPPSENQGFANRSVRSSSLRRRFLECSSVSTATLSKPLVIPPGPVSICFNRLPVDWDADDIDDAGYIKESPQTLWKVAMVVFSVLIGEMKRTAFLELIARIPLHLDGTCFFLGIVSV